MFDPFFLYEKVRLVKNDCHVLVYFTHCKPAKSISCWRKLTLFDKFRVLESYYTVQKMNFSIKLYKDVLMIIGP